MYKLKRCLTGPRMAIVNSVLRRRDISGPKTPPSSKPCLSCPSRHRGLQAAWSSKVLTLTTGILCMPSISDTIVDGSMLLSNFIAGLMH